MAGLQAWRPADWPVAAGWQPLLDDFFQSAVGHSLGVFIAQRLRDGATIYPDQPLRALQLTAPDQVRVLILGQDPYHGAGQAEGLAFSVPQGVRVPPSLRNIHQELQRDLGNAPPASSSLLTWAGRGVLLLNACLTVEQGMPASHAGRGWEHLCDAVIAEVARRAPHCVYMLWGAHAQKKSPLIEWAAAAGGQQALVLQANHPSPLSARRAPAPFIGCGHFSKANAWLATRGSTVRWQASSGGLADLLAQCDSKARPPADLALWEAARPAGKEVW